MPVGRSGIPPDEPREEMRWAEPHAETVLRRNPDLELHHMQDPVQDRLMVRRMSYFRLKRRTLGEAYERFLRERLAPGGTIIVMECGLQWPTTRRGDRYVFQFGALGGATADEMMHGGDRVEAYLRNHRSPRTRWEPPPADGTSPEAEWGFAPALREDIERFARRHNYRVQRIVFEQPEAMSPLVADLYRWWYERLGVVDSDAQANATEVEGQLRAHYPDLRDKKLVRVDVVDDGERLDTVGTATQDFVIANHFLEHAQDPIGTIQRLLQVLRPQGILYLAVPDKRFTFDEGRPLTTLDHLIRDHTEGPEWSCESHFREWVEIVCQVVEQPPGFAGARP